MKVAEKINKQISTTNCHREVGGLTYQPFLHNIFVKMMFFFKFSGWKMNKPNKTC